MFATKFWVSGDPNKENELWARARENAHPKKYWEKNSR